MSTTNPNTTTTRHAAASAAAANEADDLGQARYDQATAAIGDRDSALYAPGPVLVRQGRAPAGMESQIFAWSTFQFETEDRDGREELKGDLHGGQLHRQNRAARGEPTGLAPPTQRGGRGGYGGGGYGGGGVRGHGLGQEKGQGHGQGQGQQGEGLVCGVRSSADVPKLAKGRPVELDEEMFWKERLV